MKVKKMLSKVTTLIMVGILLVGCTTTGEGGQKAGAKAGGKEVTVETSKDGTTREMEGNLYLEGLPIVKEKETFTIAVIGHPLAKDTYENKPAVIKAQEDTNIEIKWMEIPSTGWQEKINIMFASGQLPDAIATGISASSIVKNLPQLIPVGDYIDRYAPHVSEVYNTYPEIKTMLEQEDGKIYSFMTNAHSARNDTTSGVLFLNKQWLDNLGLEVPTTVEEYYEVLKAFKEKDPNGNGLNDEIPLSFCQQFYASQFSMLLGSFGIKDGTDHIMIEDGKVEFAPAKPEYYEALKYYNQLAKEELLDLEGFSQTQQQYYSKGQQMVVGSFLEYLPYFAVGEQNDSQYIALPPLKSSVSEPLWDGQKEKFAGWNGGFVITKACKNPEALIRWFDYVNSDFSTKMEWYFGERNVLWDMNDETGDYWYLNNLPEGVSKGEYRYTTSAGPHGPMFITLDELDKFQLKDDPKGEQRSSYIDMLEPYFPEENMLTLFESLEVTEEKANLQVEIDNYIKSFVAQAVLSGIDDAKWQEHLDKLEKLNVGRYLELQQASYDRINK
ncbi:extracellular solute-binding protein [Niameybacter massiliensis]|uniref:Extracellular solute-binding protein n=1 Tax=Holtiella tumoricola TaxID=3018743 RepID=A0AA42DQ35_9FIRM|nr:extracellular solute-binding protein [Holtiella tumoricola]MDA3733185.1 extracellular solute-binding protein [Holtiella tumoricola]